VVHLLAVLKSRLAGKTVYVEKAKELDNYPYIILKLPESIDTIPKENFMLIADIWDKNNDNTQIENLQNWIIEKLDRFKYKDGNLVIRIFFDGRGMIPDPEKDIRRRELRFECQVFWLK
jgi:hypothetical protein